MPAKPSSKILHIGTRPEVKELVQLIALAEDRTFTSVVSRAIKCYADTHYPHLLSPPASPSTLEEVVA